MTDILLGGYIPEPIKPEQWTFETDFKAQLVGLPSVVTGDIDLRPFTSPRHDQMHTNSCVAQSVVKALEINRIKAFGREAHVDLSVLAVYYLAREIMTPSQATVDDGTCVSYACDVLRRFGVPPETEWTYDPFRVNMSPSWMAMRKAYTNKIDAYYRIVSYGQDRVDEVANAIRSGYPVVYGTRVGNNWKNYLKGDVLGIVATEDELGGHATVLLGVQGDKFIGENSWGRDWGDDGFYLASSELIESYKSGDFFVVTGSWMGKP